MSVAVVIPLFNHEKFIGEALRSLLAQERLPDRIVVVDDGSSDGSAAAVRQFDDPRIRLLEQENRGAHAALNRAIVEAADCDLIGILNSDDVYHPERLAQCEAYLRKNPDREMVTTGYRIIDAETKELPADDPKVRRARAVWEARALVESPAEWLGIANFAKTSSNFVCRRDFLVSHPFKDYRYTHDYFLAAFAAMHDRLGVLEAPLLFYRVHGTNTIKADGNDRVVRETIRLNLELLRKLKPSLAESAAVRARYAAYMRRLGENFSDFRLEAYLAALAGAMEEVPPRVVGDLVEGMTPEAYPELAERTSKHLRERLAERELAKLERELAESRWYQLGRALGRQPDVLNRDEPVASVRLAGARKALKHSKWLRMGRKFGVVSDYGPAR